MKKVLGILLLSVMLFSLAACGANTYKVETTSGETYWVDGEPELKKDRYIFEDSEGKQTILNKADVKVVQEAERPDEEPTAPAKAE